MLAIMHTIHQWQQYLLGNKLLVKMGHNSLKHFLDQSSLSYKQQKWVSEIQYFYLNIIYKKGKENVVVVALSRISKQSTY